MQSRLPTTLALGLLGLSAGCFLFTAPFSILNQCESNDNCYPGELCLSGYCYDRDYISVDACTSVEECDDGYYCYEGYCLDGSESPLYCRDDVSVCDDYANTACVDGYCAELGQSCSDHDDCPEDSYCNMDADQCTPPDPEANGPMLKGGFWNDIKPESDEDLSIFDEYETLAGSLYLGTDYFGSEVHVFTTTEINLGSVRTITDDLVITNQTNVLRVYAPNLKRIGGSLIVEGNASITQLYFPALVDLGSGPGREHSIQDNPRLEEISLPLATAIDDFSILNNGTDEIDPPAPMIIDLGSATGAEAIDIDENPNVASVDLSSLVSVTDALTLSSMTLGADAIDLSSLNTVGANLKFYNVVGPTAIRVPALSQVTGSLDVNTIANLSAASFPALASVGGSLEVTSNPAMQSLFAPELVAIGGRFRVRSNDVMDDWDFSKLTAIGDDQPFNVYGNPAFNSCRALELAQQCSVPDENISISSNLGNVADCGQ